AVFIGIHEIYRTPFTVAKPYAAALSPASPRHAFSVTEAHPPAASVKQALFSVCIRISRCPVLKIVASTVVVFIHKRRSVLSGSCCVFSDRILILSSYHPYR